MPLQGVQMRLYNPLLRYGQSSHLELLIRSLLTSVEGYSDAALIAAVNTSSPYVPILNMRQLLQVLYTCIDTMGDIAAKSFCIAGCIDMGDIKNNDQCAM